MNYYERHQATIGTAISLLLIAIFVVWAELDRDSLHRMANEDGPIETLSAIFFGLSSICFIVFAYRSDFLKEKGLLIYFMTISWALLMFIFMGEEISWGQRIFDISTPETLSEMNLQNEINIHNLEAFDTFLGGKYRYLSIMMLTTGLLLPVFALSKFGKSMIQRFAFPVSPLCYAPLFVGAYVYGKYYSSMIGHDAAEVRELLMSVGMFLFAINGAAFPRTLFRISISNREEMTDDSNTILAVH